MSISVCLRVWPGRSTIITFEIFEVALAVVTFTVHVSLYLHLILLYDSQQPSYYWRWLLYNSMQQLNYYLRLLQECGSRINFCDTCATVVIRSHDHPQPLKQCSQTVVGKLSASRWISNDHLDAFFSKDQLRLHVICCKMILRLCVIMRNFLKVPVANRRKLVVNGLWLGLKKW